MIFNMTRCQIGKAFNLPMHPSPPPLQIIAYFCLPANLRETFDKLDFVVKYHENLTDNGMMQLLVDMAHNIDHKNFDCFVCCILTHGVLSHLYGTNGKLVRIKDLTSVFQANRCPSLAGKPKLFFLQACQGRDKMGGKIRLTAS